MAVTKMLHTGSDIVNSDVKKGQRDKRKKSDPIDTLIEAIWDFVDAQYEDTDVTDEELALAKRRFKSALQYLIVTTMEQYNNEKE